VIDASALVDVLTGSERRTGLEPHLDDDLFAPDVLVAEVLSGLRTLTRRGHLAAAAAERCARDLVEAEIEYLPVWPYTEQDWTLRHTITPYQAYYVALAADLRAPLLTTDLRLAAAAAGIVPIIAV
jgi:predicted nucleic acid-binding protein